MRDPPRETEGVTLDLSIKKPREVTITQSSKMQHQISSQSTVFRVAQPPPDQQGFFHQVCFILAQAIEFKFGPVLLILYISSK